MLKMTITDYYISDTVEGNLTSQSQTTVILQRGPDQSITDYSDAAGGRPDRKGFWVSILQMSQ